MSLLYPSLLSWDLPTAAQRIGAGLPTTFLSDLQAQLHVSQARLADVLQIPARTLARRQTQARLPPDESERVYRLARLSALAADVHGNPDAGRAWLLTANYALGEVSPLDMARTEPGARLVEALLYRLAEGQPA